MIKHHPGPFTISYYSAAEARIKTKDDILVERWLHKVFVVTHIPALWSASKLALALLVAAGLVWYSWFPLGPIAFTVAAIYLGFALTDWLLLSSLPQSGRSFGPVGPQLLLLTVPRVGVAILIAVALLVIGRPDYVPPSLWLFILLQLSGTLIYLWGIWYEPFALTITQKTIRSPYMPHNAPPIRLLHLSDFHIERLTRREAQLLELIGQAQPDLIVITGDYLNLSYVNEPVARAEVRKLLAAIDAPYGVYATLGSPTVDPRDTTPSLFHDLPHIRLLRDEVAVLDFGDGRKLSLLGLDCEHDLESDGRVFETLVRLAPADSTRVLLYHSPELMPLVQQHPVDLYLCGHTHGGQVRLPIYGAILTSSTLGKKYEMGAYREQNTTLYISRGIGLEGLGAPRMRLLCPPEMILFTLTCKQ